MWQQSKPEISPPLSSVPSSTPTGSAPGVTLIGQAVSIRGRVESDQDLYIDGDVQGSLDVAGSRLTIGPHGKVVAGSKVRELEVLGSLDGDVESSDKVSVRNGGRLVGDVRTAGILIEDGAYFKGGIDIVRPEMQPIFAARDEPEPEIAAAVGAASS